MKLLGLLLCISLTCLMKNVNDKGHSAINNFQSFSFPTNFYHLPAIVLKSGYVKTTPECFSTVIANPGTTVTHIVYRDCDTGTGEYYIQPGDTVSTVCMDFFGGVQVPEGQISIVSMTNCAL